MEDVDPTGRGCRFLLLTRIVTRIVVAAHEQDALLTIDGQEAMPLAGGDAVEVRQGRTPVSLVRSRDHTYYDVLRSKLGWGAR